MFHFYFSIFMCVAHAIGILACLWLAPPIALFLAAFLIFWIYVTRISYGIWKKSRPQ